MYAYELFHQTVPSNSSVDAVHKLRRISNSIYTRTKKNEFVQQREWKKLNLTLYCSSEIHYSIAEWHGDRIFTGTIFTKMTEIKANAQPNNNSKMSRCIKRYLLCLLQIMLLTSSHAFQTTLDFINSLPQIKLWSSGFISLMEPRLGEGPENF